MEEMGRHNELKVKKESEWLKEMKRNPNLIIFESNGVNYLIEDGLFKLIIIDKATIELILKEYHDTVYSGHHGFDITYSSIRKDYYFREMYSR